MSKRLTSENLTEEEIGDIMQNFIDEIFADSDSDCDSKEEENSISDSHLDVRIDREIIFLDQVQLPDIPESVTQYIEKNPQDFNWHIPDFIEPIEKFKFSGRTGIRQTDNLEMHMSENVLQFFERYFSEDLLFILAEQTNIYAAQYEKILHTHSKRLHSAKWVETNMMEIKRFLAATLLMGHIKKDSIMEYWSTEELVETPIFRKIMPRDRYLAILKYLHFTDNSFPQDKNNSDSDQLWKIRTIFNMLNYSFKEAYDPAEEVGVSEVSMKFKVRASFQQRILKKQKKLGMKMCRIIDKTGYTYHMEMHEGKDENRELTEAAAHALVMKLTKCIAGKGHKLYMDDSFSSPNLFRNLLEEYKIHSCGLVKPNRKNFPKFLDKSVKGKTSIKYCKGMTALRWTDKRNIYLLTNMHEPPIILSSLDTKEEKFLEKPEIVSDCYRHMGYADLSDYMMNSYTFGGRSLKWTKKIFFRLLDISVLNAFYLSKLENPNITLKSFRLALIRELLSTTESCAPKITSLHTKERRLEMHSSGHWPCEEKKKRRRCVVCSTKGRQKRTTVSCIKCNVGLCIKDCFRDFHC